MNTTVPTQETDTKACCKCHRELPITEFRRMYKDRDVRHNECRECFNAYLRKRYHERRTKGFKRFSLSVHYNRRNKERLIEIVGMMTDRCGGLRRFVDKWHAAIEEATTKRDSAIVLRHLMAIVDLISVANQFESELVREMDQEARERYIKRKLMHMVEEKPQIALWAASKLDGWTVIPPAGVELE